MDKELYIFLFLQCLGFLYCNEECHWLQSHKFEVKDDEKFLFKADIKKPDGLLIDIIYENKNRKNDRITISPEKSAIYKYTEGKYLKTSLDSAISEGLHNISVSVGNSEVYIECTSLRMIPVSFKLQSRILYIKVSAVNLMICEESCKILTNIEKNLEDSDTFRITVFTNSKHPIKLNISYSREDGDVDHLELKPGECNLKLKQSTKIFTCDYIQPGWNRLNIFLNKTSLTINNNTVIKEVVNLKAIRVSGSYLVNCTHGTPKWKVLSKTEMEIPISPSQVIRLGLKSKELFSPAFNLDGNMLSLYWNNGLKFGSGQPLPPKSYYIMFELVSQMLILYDEWKSGKQLLMELKMDEVPEFIVFSSLKGEYLITLYVPYPDEQPTEHRTLPSGDGETNSSPIKNFLIASSGLIILAIILSSTLFVWKKNNKKREAKIQVIASKDTEEDNPLMQNVEPRDRDETKITIDDVYLSSNTPATQVEIHNLSGNTDDEDLDRNKQVIQVVKELDDAIASIFNAIKERRLYGARSADSLLTEHGLPGTIRDRQGNSILNCLVLTMKQYGPDEDADTIKKFIKEHKILLSAVNLKGQTALHTLASEASDEDSSNKWESMTKLLIDIGCNSGVRNNDNQLPDDIASSRGCKYLQDLIRQKREVIEEIDMKTKKEQWFTLLKATKENNLDLVTELLQDNVPILPLYATKDPLKEAIQRGHTELTMLLLSAGAPLCGRPLIGLNSLEVSHAKPGLDVRLPALIRREFYNCLKSESEMLKDGDSELKLLLKDRVIDLAESVKKYGYKNENWNLGFESRDRSQRSKEARKMLNLASEWGMGLTCQMLGLEDVSLHPLLPEVSPDKNAKSNTLDVLYRDLELSLSFKMKKEYEEYNLEKLREFCVKKAIDINSLYNEQTAVNKDVLKFIAEQGFYIIYKKIFLKRNGKVVNVTVDDATGFTMLHSAAYNGRMGMVEYLLMNNADETVKTDKGFTAAHVAAIRGHKECMEYILHISELRESHISKAKTSLIDDKTHSGLTAHQISNVYASEVENQKTFLLHESVSHPVLLSYSSEPKFKRQAQLVLSEKQSIIQDCLSRGSLDEIIPPMYIKEQNEIWQQLNLESENFLQILSEVDPRFKGRIIYHHKTEDALELLLMDSYQIYLELENNDIWETKNLYEAFLESGLKAMKNFVIKSKNLCLLPPVFKQSAIGANIYVAYCSRQACIHISIHVVPVLKVDFQLPQKLHIPQKFDDIIANTSITNKVFTRSQKWSYDTTYLENKLLDSLDNDKLRVLSLCRFIKKLLNSPWWFPRLESRRHGRQWHHYAVTLQSVEERYLKSCFLLEVFKYSEEKWNNQHITDRVLGVFENMVKQEANCFLDQGKDVIKVWPTIIAIIEFLKIKKGK